MSDEGAPFRDDDEEQVKDQRFMKITNFAKEHHKALIGTSAAIGIAASFGCLLLITIISVICAIVYGIKAMKKKKK